MCAFSCSQNINQLEIFGDMSTPPDITSPSVSSCCTYTVCDFHLIKFTAFPLSFLPLLFFLNPDLQSQPTQTPASPANTLDPLQGLQPPTELFAPFNPASVPSGRTLNIFYLNTPPLQAKEKQMQQERVKESDEGEPESEKILKAEG